jgi:HSP20 family molecular chaperone IbpA
MRNDWLSTASGWNSTQFLDDVFGPSILPRRISTSAWTVKKTDDGLALSIDVPGVKASDLSVRIVDRELRVRGVRDGTEVSYTWRITSAVDPETCDALLVDGVLTVSFKHAASARARSVSVRTA